MTTSGANSFALDIAELTERAFGNIGKTADKITGEMARIARTYLFMTMSEWTTRGISLFAVDRQILQLDSLRTAYQLPNATVDILNAVLRSSTYASGGTPGTNAGGTAANAFDLDPATVCTQSSINGRISYDFGANTTPAIEYVGIRSNATRGYSLALEISSDGSSWTTAQVLPAQTFTAGQWAWFDVTSPVKARYFGIREMAGAILDVQDVAFNQSPIDRPMTPMARDLYINLPSKQTPGTPSQYWVDRQISPVVYPWPVAAIDTTQMVIWRIRHLYDPGAPNFNPDVPQRWIKALMLGLARDLAGEFAADRYDAMDARAEKAFKFASDDERERGELRIQPDLSGYFR